jgi:hypothetical protein
VQLEVTGQIGKNIIESEREIYRKEDREIEKSECVYRPRVSICCRCEGKIESVWRRLFARISVMEAD